MSQNNRDDDDYQPGNYRLLSGRHNSDWEAPDTGNMPLFRTGEQGAGVMGTGNYYMSPNARNIYQYLDGITEKGNEAASSVQPEPPDVPPDGSGVRLAEQKRWADILEQSQKKMDLLQNRQYKETASVTLASNATTPLPDEFGNISGWEKDNGPPLGEDVADGMKKTLLGAKTAYLNGNITIGEYISRLTGGGDSTALDQIKKDKRDHLQDIRAHEEKMRWRLEQLGKPGTAEYKTNYAIRSLHQKIGEHIPALLGGLFTKGISGGVKIGGEIALETSEIFNGMLEESQDPSLKRALVEGGISVGSNKYFYHTIKATLKAKIPGLDDSVADAIAQSGADYMHGWFRGKALKNRKPEEIR